MFGRDLAERGALVEEAIRVLRAAWSGEEFERAGHRLHVTPLPAQPGGPRIVLGGSTPASARRAARIGDGYAPTDPRLVEVYDAERRRLRREPAPAPGRHLAGFVFVSDDPDRDWATIAPHALHETNAYGAWLAKAGISGPFESVADAAALRASGRYRVVTADECVALLRGVDHWMIHPLMGGLPPELSWQSLERIAADVLPALRAETDRPATRTAP
jgi:alkanesulfonate monooxygenase SsuD/methylene tetrahydromethanopterin reductase-like flavin-dependent oxidoreductase (luciferase family)